jgi:PAS domain S-box-containing protein
MTQGHSLRLGEGLSGLVAKTGQVVYSADTRVDPRNLYREGDQALGIVSYLGLPIAIGGEVVGVLAFNTTAPRAYAQAEIAYLRSFADQAAIAIENARLFEAVRRELAERRRTEDALRQSQTLLQSIFRSAPTGIGLVCDRVMQWANDTLCRMVGYAPEELIGQSARLVYPTDEEFERVGRDKYAQIRAEGRGTVETRWRCKDGRILDILLSSSPLDPADPGKGMTFTALDITDRKRMEAILQTRTEQLEALRIVNEELTRELDLATLLDLITRRAIDLLGAGSGTIYLWDDAAEVLVPAAWLGLGAWFGEVRYRLGEGVCGTIAARRRGMIVNDFRASPYVTPHIVAHADIRAVVGEPLLSRERLLGVIMVRDRVSGAAFSAEDQELLRLFAVQAAIAIENARLYADLRRSYDDLQRAQDELIRTEKLRGLGQMAAGIAHDLNNTLAAILGQAELLRLQPLPFEARDSLRILRTAADDGAQVVRRLQDFARQKSGGSLAACDLAGLLQETLEITRPRWREDPQRRGSVIQVATDVAGLPPIQGNAAEVREALTNLILNAVDAMPEGGTLSFAGRVVDAPSATHESGPGAPAPEPGNPAGAWLELSVSDTGVGMTEEVRRRAFDPFFTTKGVHGTGLGLSVVYGIIQRHGGHIDVVSEPGKGTTFRLRFRPAHADSPPPQASRTRTSTPPRRILVVDDDASVRETLASLLRASGHRVIEADGGAAGLARLATAEVDMVLTDLGMPDVTGWDVAREAKRRRPGLPVVLVTGWGDQVEAEAPAGDPVDRVLAKPVQLKELLGLIAELTAGP